MEKRKVNHKGLGTLGESIAEQHLIDSGYTIVEKNFRVRSGELDIIANDTSGTLVFIEVKTSQGYFAGDPAEWITLKKQRQLYKMALMYCSTNSIEDVPMRFDVITVVFQKNKQSTVNHIQNAFYNF